MDALLLRSLQGYVRDTFGLSVWQAVCRRAMLRIETFEPMLRYDLVMNPRQEGARRLLRFGGASFADFLLSLEEMPGRARLALPDLRLPEIRVVERGPDLFEIVCPSPIRGFPRVLVGILTSMADDYGTLCVIETDGDATITVRILDSTHSEGRPFDLATPEG